MKASYLLILLIAHWIGDFVLQSDWMAKNKYRQADALTLHVMVYSIFISLVVVWMIPNPVFVIIFLVITSVVHGITDKITSQFTHYFFIEKKNTHWAFVVVGFDQILHYIQLYLTFKLCIV